MRSLPKLPKSIHLNNRRYFCCLHITAAADLRYVRFPSRVRGSWMHDFHGGCAMLVRTTRFANVEVPAEDLIRFPDGMLGLDDCQSWVLLADAQNDAIGWLQSTTRASVALAVVSPRRFVPDYQLRVFRRELASLDLAQAGRRPSADDHVQE